MNIYFEFIKMISALLVVLGLMFLLLKLLKHRIMPKGGFINMIHYQPLGTKRAIAIVKIANEYFALGLCENSISVITKMDANQIESQLKELPTEDIQDEGFGFKKIFSKLTGGRI
ncbi:MAG TPA: flagellar biosynthetic protein FliO [Nitrospirae bacterium]|nr:flagellar biosynthetic protein FliO [Nitrospirota bacterium]